MEYQDPKYQPTQKTSFSVQNPYAIIANKAPMKSSSKTFKDALEYAVKTYEKIQEQNRSERARAVAVRYRTAFLERFYKKKGYSEGQCKNVGLEDGLYKI